MIRVNFPLPTSKMLENSSVMPPVAKPVVVSYSYIRRSRNPWESGLSGPAWQQWLKLSFDTYRFSTTWLLLEQSRCVEAAKSRWTQEKGHMCKNKKENGDIYLSSAQASFLPLRGMAKVRRCYIQMCTLDTLTWTMYKGSSMSEPKEHVNVQRLHTHPVVGVTWPDI